MRWHCRCGTSISTVRRPRNGKPRRLARGARSVRLSQPIGSAFSMSNEKMTYQDLLQIVELVKASSQFSEFHLKVGDVEVDLKRHSAGTPSRAADPQAQISTAVNDTARAIPLPVSASQPVETARTIRHRPGHVGGGEIVTELPPDVVPIDTDH